jgi:transcriptional regulator with XRE-family HTH domain
MTDRARSRVRAWMAAEELTQSRAAERLGVSQGAVSQLLNGTTAAPSLALAQALERETAGWDDGPIRTEEWVTETADAAKPDAA